jgi:hypothetical protein
LVVDVGCGGGGMAKALAAAVPDATVVALDADEEVLRQAREHTAGLVRCELVSMDDGPEPLRAAIGAPADLVWASASSATTVASGTEAARAFAMPPPPQPTSTTNWSVGRTRAAATSWFQSASSVAVFRRCSACAAQSISVMPNSVADHTPVRRTVGR